MDIEQIRNAASCFRNAIEARGPYLEGTFEDFPRGTCGEVVLMLGTYLMEQGLGEFQYMLGEYGSHKEGTWRSHAWLQSNDLIIDITADQFSEISEKVIIEKDSEWHRQLNGKQQHRRADYRIFDRLTRKRIGRMYHQIIDFINAK